MQLFKNLLQLIFLLLLSSIFTTSCSNDNSSTKTITDETVETGGHATTEVTLSVSAHPDNTLMAIARVETTDDASVFIEYESAATTTYQTNTTDSGTSHEITVIGMRAETEYTMTAVATLPDSSTISSESFSFTTGSLPATPPELNVVTSTPESEGGVTLFGTKQNQSSSDSGGQYYWGVDEAGEIVWYLHGDHKIFSDPVIRSVGPGKLMVFADNSLKTVTTAGEIIDTNQAGKFHHDAILLPSGNSLSLYTEEITNNDGILLTGDVIIETDSSGNTTGWEWKASEHLDTLRFPGDLSISEDTDSGARDWTHSNSLFYVEEDNSIIISMRSQSWVIKIDYDTGKIIWIMGESSGSSDNFYTENSDKFFTLESGSWMGNQHAAMLTGAGEILMFDNRNETNGFTEKSRAVKYSLDVATMTATQTWESIAPKYSGALGDADEQDGGNVLYVPGGPGGRDDQNAYIVEASDTTGATVWSMTVGTYIYRAERISWDNFLNIGNSSDFTNKNGNSNEYLY